MMYTVDASVWVNAFDQAGFVNQIPLLEVPGCLPHPTTIPHLRRGHHATSRTAR